MSRVRLVVMAEAVAAMIALIMPVTPSRSTGDWDLGRLLFAEPTYLQSAAACFVAPNLLIGLVWGGFRLVAREGGGR